MLPGNQSKTVLLTALLALGLSACGGDPQTTSTDTSASLTADAGEQGAAPSTGVGAELLPEESLTEYDESASAYRGTNAFAKTSATKDRDLSTAPTPAIVTLGQATSAQKATFAEKAKKAEGDPDQRQVPTGFGRWVTPVQQQGSAARSGSASSLNWTPQAGGWRAAALGVDAGDAKGLRLGVYVGALPESAVLRFYARNSTRMIEIPAKAVLTNLRGKKSVDATAFSASTFWSPALDGAVGIVEVAIPPSASVGDVNLAIEQVVHMVKSREERSEPVADYSGSCQQDAMCAAVGAGTEQEKARDAVTLIETLVFDKFGVATSHTCTGTLLTDNAWSGVPHLLTADHCVSNQIQAANSYVWTWWRASACNATTAAQTAYDDWGNVEGYADYLYSETKSSGTDVGLLRLDMYGSMPEQAGQVPALAGWDARTFSSGPVSAFHHPSGDWLKHSVGGAVYKSSNFLKVTWTSGTTEGGSSGGALLNNTGQVIGTLWGGSSSCSEPSLPDYYGRFSAAYSRGLRNWLHMPAQELVAAADLNGDGERSLLLRPRVVSKAGTQTYAAASMGQVGADASKTLNILGWSQFGGDSELIWGQPKIVAVADMNGDGREDLVYRITGADGLDLIKFAHIDDEVNEDDEVVEVETLHSRLDKGIVVVGMGDLDGDGIPDLVLRDPKTYTLTYLLVKRDSGEYWVEPVLRGVYIWNGFTYVLTDLVTTWPLSKYMAPLAVGDFFGDGRAEVLFRDSRSPSVAQFYTYSVAGSFPTMMLSKGRLKTFPGTLIGAARLNDDTKLDLVFNSSGKISYAYTEVGATDGTYTSDYQMGVAVTSLTATQTSGMSFSLLADFDADGKADMVWRNKTTGELGYTLSSRIATLPLVLTRGADAAAVALARARP